MGGVQHIRQGVCAVARCYWRAKGGLWESALALTQLSCCPTAKPKRAAWPDASSSTECALLQSLNRMGVTFDAIRRTRPSTLTNTTSMAYRMPTV